MHYNFYLYSFLLICLLLHAKIGKICGETTNYCFKQISTEQGLSQSTVTCILSEHNGMIWIGTKNGLNRFDQYELKNYYSSALENTLPDDYINFIAEDSLFNVWVGTNKGLVRYDRENDNFIPINIEGKPFPTYSFYHCPMGIMFGGFGSLYFFDYKTEQLNKMALSVELAPIEYNHILSWTGDVLILGSRYEGIYAFDRNKNTLKELSLVKKKDITSLYVDTQKRIWLSPYNQGLYCFSSDGKQILHLSRSNSDLNNDIILDIIERDGKIWLATDGGGINIYDPVESKIKIITEEGGMYSLPEKSILCLYNDDDNNLWAGSIRGGLLRIKETCIRTYKNVPLHTAYGLSDKVVISLYEDVDGILWIGTDGGGLNSYDPRSMTFTHYPGTYQYKVVSIAKFSDEQLIISLFGEGIYLFNKNTETLSAFILVNSDVNAEECTSGSSVYLDHCSENKILFLGKKIYLYDKLSHRFSLVKGLDPYYQNLLQKVTVGNPIAYLMGQYHLVKLDSSTDRVEVIYDNHGKMALEAAAYDGDSCIWIGTYNGLYRFSVKDKIMKRIETNLFHGVSSLTCDEKGRLWIGAQNMLFCYIPNENRFIILGESDGVYPNELFPMAAYKSYSNTLYLGGASGLICINKDIIFESDVLPTVQLADVIINGVSRMKELSVNDSRNISVPWNTSSIEVKFSTKEKDIFRKKMFRYNIVGVNKQYVESYNRTLSIVSLAPGNYTIMVSCSSQSGTWSKPMDILHISVIPPFWKRAYFVIVCICLSILFVVSIACLIIKRNKNQLKWKMKEHEKEVDEQKIRFLINVSHELRTPLTLIYAPLKRILDRGRIKDLELEKELTGIFKRARQMKNIINMVLDVRKMEVGQDALHLESHELNQWICTIGGDFQCEFAAKEIELIYNLDDHVLVVSFDSSKCEIVLSNLIMNALKYSNPKSKVTISTQLLENDKMVRVSIADQGIGLEGVDLNKLFTRFYRGNYDRSGTGIGLSYAKVLVEMHQGRIGAYNNEGAGAIFYFDLPYTDLPGIISCQPKHYLNELLYSEEQNRLEMQEFDTHVFSVLVVEDDPELNSFLKDVLKDRFSRVYTAGNGREALDIVSGCLPDVIISDVMMPQMDGLELCKLIKSDLNISHIPIILLTARTDTESSIFGYKMGADAYLTKPFETDLLYTVIQNLLKRREQMKQQYRNSSSLPVPQDTTISNADEKFLLKLNKIISDNIDNPLLDVKFITDNMCVSRASLYNKMKALVDMGVNDYINKFRIEKAIDLLSNTDLSVTEISERAGFSYQRYFSSVFKQIKGVTPSSFRQNVQNERKEKK